MIIYEWYYNIPAVKWPKGYFHTLIILGFFLFELFLESGFEVGINTDYRYVVIHIRYFQFDINDIYGQQITMARRKY